MSEFQAIAVVSAMQRTSKAGFRHVETYHVAEPLRLKAHANGN